MNFMPLPTSTDTKCLPWTH